jgi:hypothetical protein
MLWNVRRAPSPVLVMLSASSPPELRNRLLMRSAIEAGWSWCVLISCAIGVSYSLIIENAAS